MINNPKFITVNLLITLTLLVLSSSCQTLPRQISNDELIERREHF